MSENENKDIIKPLLDEEKIIEYANVFLEYVNNGLNDERLDKDISINELLLAIGLIIPKSIYENVNDNDNDNEISLLELNHLFNKLLFELKK